MKQTGQRQRVKLDELVIAANQNVREKEYWLKRLSGDLVKTSFPYDSNGKMNQRSIEAVKFSLPGNLYEKLMALSKESERKLNMILAAGLAALLHKYTGSIDILMGTPIYRQKTEGNFINTALVLRQQVEASTSFKDLLLEIRQTLFEAIEHRDFPVEILAEQLKLSAGDNGDFPLFDVAVLLENIHDKSYIDYIPCNMIFSFLKTAASIEGVVEYNSGRYNKTSVTRIINHFTCLLESVLFNVNLALSDVSIVRESEKKRILFEFNNTQKEVVRDKCYHRLFEDRAAQPAVIDRTAVVCGALHVTYGALNEEANRMSHCLHERGCQPGSIIGLYMKRNIKILTAILGIFKAGSAYLPIESDYPQERIKRILEDSGIDQVITTENLRATLEGAWQWKEDRETDTILCLNKDELADGVLQSYPVTSPQSSIGTGQLAYIIYTSGSTGKPKGVMIHQQGMINHLFAKINDLGIQADDITAQTASICFDISVWQFLSGLLVDGRVLIIPRDIVMEPLRLLPVLQKYRVTILEVVPSLMSTFLQLVKDEKDRELKHLRWMIPTGEALGVHLAREWFRYFPRIKIVNAYGPTEASDDVTHYMMAESPPENLHHIPIGKPIQNTHIYIMDKHLSLCPIGVSGEICVAGLGVGKGYFKDPDKTAAAFVPNPLVEEIDGKIGNKEDYATLYKTGDVGCFREDGNIDIFGRIDFQVKIRGNRIELGEIEHSLLNYPGIKEAVVMAREKESGDKYLCAYLAVNGELPESPLKEYLAGVLPDYMVPSYFVQMEQFPLTVNGKIDRKALPEPQLKAEETFIPPRNKLEEKLVELWADVLEIEEDMISIDANFFELGGDSMNGTILVSKIHKEFNVKVPFPEIFRKPEVRLLAEYISQLSEDRYTAIVPLEKKDYYPLSSAQKRLFILQQMDPASSSYNILQVIPLGAAVDKDKMTATFQQMIRRHDSLRTSFDLLGEQPIQVIHTVDLDFNIRYAQLDTLGREQVEDMLGSGMARDFLQAFDLSIAPLLRVGIIRINDDLNLMLINIHHIISDAPSQEVLERDFTRLYQGEALFPLKIQYKEYAHWQNSDKVKQAIEKQKQYWMKKFADEIPILDLPADYPRPPIWTSEGKNLDFELSEADANALNEIVLEEDTTLFVVLLTIFNVFLYKITDQKNIVIGTPVIGRTHADLEKIVGMFLNTLPLRNFPQGEKSFSDFFREVHERFIKAFDNQGYQFEELVEDLAVTRDPSRNPIFDVMFAFLDASGETRTQIAGDMVTSHLQPIISMYEYEKAKFDLTLNAFPREGHFFLSFEYSTNLFKEETIKRFIGYFRRVLAEILENRDKPISQIEIMSPVEKKQLLIDFNDTDVDFANNKPVQSFLEEWAVRSPQNPAVLFEDKELTYQALNQKANQVAAVLREKGVGPGTVVSLMVKRSLEMLIGIFAILKAGGAYLPIEPEFPEERKKYFYRDSTAAITLTQGSLALSWRDMGEAIDLEDESLYKDKENCGNPEETAGTQDIVYIIYTSGTTGKPKGVMIEHRSLINRLTWMQRSYPLGEQDVLLQKTTFVFDVSVWELFAWSLHGSSVCMLKPDGEKSPEVVIQAIDQRQITVMHFVPSMLGAFLDYLEGFGGEERLGSLRQVFTSGETLPGHYLTRFDRLLRETAISNLYGPTETTVEVSYYNCKKDEQLDNIPIGKPIPNSQFYILNRELRLLPIGITGELYIGGDNVARGYLNQPELTAEKFIDAAAVLLSTTTSDDPDNEIKKKLRVHGRIYRSGDLTRWLPDGNVQFLGRVDHQVKIRGFRIEPGEIQRRMLSHHLVKNAVVIPDEEVSSEKNLCAYIVAEGEINVLEMREYLAGELPEYMIPAYFFQVDEIPLTSNGKLDRKKLNTHRETLEAGIEYIAPNTDLEKKITGIWKDILKIDKVGLMDNFFLVGGNSLKVILLYRRLRQELDLDFSVAALFDRVTVSAFVQYLQEREKEERIQARKEIKRAGEINQARDRKRKQISRRRAGAANG